jgi:hypothetical protein
LSEIAQRQCGEELTVNGLSVRMALHQTTASNLVNVLAKRGLIQRQRSAPDQRVVDCESLVITNTACPSSSLSLSASAGIDNATPTMDGYGKHRLH